jgi:hypothetical protein
MGAVGIVGTFLASAAVAIRLQRLDWAVLSFVSLLAVSNLTFINLKARAEHGMKPTCACLTTSVEYVGWYGTVHEFTAIPNTRQGGRPDAQ